MTQEDRLYRCAICGIVTSVLIGGNGDLSCCGEKMQQLAEQGASEEGKEKHVPEVRIEGDSIVVQVGSTPHPMEEKHYIQLVQLLDGDRVIMGKRLRPGQQPEVTFHNVQDPAQKRIRELCNVHGLWTT